MNIKIALTGARLVLGLAIASTFCATSTTAAAASREVTVAIQLNTQGIDLANAADAQRFYRRLEHAAWEVCTGDVRVGLAPNDNAKECIQRALADAIRSVKAPLLTQIYLATHTLQEAAAHGIEAPQFAAK